MPLGKKLEESVRASAQASLEHGETVEVVTSALVGQVSAAKFVGVAVGVAVVTGGALTAFVRPKKFFVVLTDRRVLFLEGNAVSGRATSKVAIEIPRSALATQSVRTKRVTLVVPTLVVELAVSGWEKGLRLQFPTPCRVEGRHIAQTLQR